MARYEQVGAGPLVNLDIGLELVCDRSQSLVVYTRGFFVCASLLGLQSDSVPRSAVGADIVPESWQKRA